MDIATHAIQINLSPFSLPPKFMEIKLFPYPPAQIFLPSSTPTLNFFPVTTLNRITRLNRNPRPAP